MANSPIAPPARIGFIGIGNMGLPMARRLVEGGYDVIGYDVAREAADRLAAVGGRAAADVKTAVGEAAIVITMLPNSNIVRQVIESARPHLPKDAVIVDMSTSEPLETQRLGKELAAEGRILVDAPVSGGVRRAIDGSLAIMAGGDAAAIDVVEPALKRMGTSIFRTGPLGSGHAMKALNNYLSGVGLVAAVEAVEIGRRFGLDPSLMVDVLNASTGRNNATDVKMKQQVLSQAYASGFTNALMAKDIRIASDLAQRLGVTAPLIGEVAALWDAVAQEAGAADHTAVGRYLGSVGQDRKPARKKAS
jgi:3-hydroxyisobutyrate dehydrogenase